MLSGTDVNVLQSSRMSPPILAPLSTQTGTYLGAGNHHENDNCCFYGGAQRSVTIAHTSNLPSTADPAWQDSEGNTPLCLAAQAGNLAEAQQLILRGADVHHINLDGDNALTLAATGGHLTFIKWLDSHCPQPVNHENYYGETALTLAARHGHQRLAQWLVSRDASLTHLNDQLKDALAEAVANSHLELAQWLSFQDTDLRRVYPDGNNLFLYAVRAGHQVMAQWLVNSGVNSQQINESGDNALTLAARHGHHQLLAWLLGKNPADIHQVSSNGDSLLLIAARQGHGETVKLLLQNGADKSLVNYAGSSVLTLAAACSESLALWLCHTGADIHQIELSGNNAFTLAAQSGFFQLMQTLERLGINIHQVNHNNDNAFTLAARHGSLRWCQWLAGKGINIHQVNHQHHNAITLAALAGSQPLLEWLCAEKMDLQQIPKRLVPGETEPEVIGVNDSFNAAILAASAGHFAEAQWLMRRGLSIHQRDYHNRNAVIQAVALGQLDAVKWFTAQSILPDRFPHRLPDFYKNERHNAMSLAARLGHLHILQWLHQNGDSLDDQDDERILLIMAARHGDLPMTQWLCQQGADIGRLDNRKKANALSVAVSCGHLRLSQWLVGQGAEDIPDIDGNDALMLAAKGGHNAIFRWLIRSESLADRQANKLLLQALRSGHRSLAVWLCLNVCNSIFGVDINGNNALMLAAKNGFLWLTQWLGEQTQDIDQTDLRGYTALMLAAANGHLPVVQWLYREKKANLHQKGVDQADALQLALSFGQTETANWLIGQGMVLNLDYFCTKRRLSWTSDINNVGLLQCLLRQKLPLRLLATATHDAIHEGNVPALAFYLHAGVGRGKDSTSFRKKCFIEAASGGSVAALEYLYHHSGDNWGDDGVKEPFLESAARFGNLHIIQWFWVRYGLTTDDQQSCLIAASEYDQLHVIKWLHSQGANIGVETDWWESSLYTAMSSGNTHVVEWFCQQGEDLHQFEENGRSALLIAIELDSPQLAIQLFHRGCRLITRDIKDIPYHRRSELLLGMIFEMTSPIRRAHLFHSSSPTEKLRLLNLPQLNSHKVTEEEADASFARLNQYSDKTLEHKCLAALVNLIAQQVDTLKEGLKVVDSLPLFHVCKFNLRELLIIKLE